MRSAKKKEFIHKRCPITEKIGEMSGLLYGILNNILMYLYI